MSLTVVPSDVTIQFVNFLDARSKANFSRVCKQIRELMEKTMKLPLSTLGFNLYLTDELFAAGMYKKTREAKQGEEWETFKREVGDIWFEALSGKTVIRHPLLHFAICDLSANGAWADAKIKKLCRALKYEAKKEMPHVPHSWRVDLKQ